MNKKKIIFEDWEFTSSDAGTSLLASSNWKPAIVPGTVAQSLNIAIDDRVNLDNCDWWYRASFSLSSLAKNQRAIINFEGLATLSEVWINGQSILISKNMFIGYHLDITKQLKDQNEIIIKFSSLESELLIKKPRPRWKTALVRNQNLRFFRTTLLGRIPIWTPEIQTVGPWKNIYLEIIENINVEVDSIKTLVEGTNGIVEVVINFEYFGTESVTGGSLIINEVSYSLNLADNQLVGKILIENAKLWWPHTHGEPYLYDCKLNIQIGSKIIVIDQRKIGFKTIFLNRENGLVQFVVNNRAIYCRGACWTVNDFLTLVGTNESLLKSLLLAKESGLNMFRIGGTMVYESDEFYNLCNDLGIMVWQDFMFANMDYPVKDSEFLKNITREVNYQVKRLSRNISLMAYCGGSEIQQQAAMMGLESSYWSNDFFDKIIPEIIKKNHSDIPYFSSSPSEGALPFHLSVGISHYYGVGAYRRDLNDTKHANVKFATECLGVSNVPSNEMIKIIGKNNLPDPHDLAWKERIPKDNGANYDFEDVRDHYLKVFFGIDPQVLKSKNIKRYYKISQIVSGEMMKRVFSEWRKPGSLNNGGLVWFYKDLWPAAGWGIIDSLGNPKAAFYELKRIWKTQAILISNEGLNGLEIHLLNETSEKVTGSLEISLFGNQRLRLGYASRTVEVLARESKSIQVDELLGYFNDANMAYSFGDPKYDVVWVNLKCPISNEVILEDFFFPKEFTFSLLDPEVVSTKISHLNSGEIILEIISIYFLQHVHFESDHFIIQEQYFHLAPNTSKKIKIVKNDLIKITNLTITLISLNLKDPIILRIDF